jgi:DNA-binding PadR family transcriptional regulator
LGSLAERGPMHGHALNALAEEEHVHLWTDIAPSGVYGAIKRLAHEGLIVEERVEKQGNYPARQVYAISDSGRALLGELRIEGLTEVVSKHDPFDLAFARLDPDRLDELQGIIEGRLARLRSDYAEKADHIAEIDQYLTLAEKWNLRHRLVRWQAEIDWHEELLKSLPEIIADEQERQRTKGHN